MSSFDGLSTFRTVREEYDNLQQAGKLKADANQLAIVAALDLLIEDLTSKRLASKSSALGWLFGKRHQAKDPVKGL